MCTLFQKYFTVNILNLYYILIMFFIEMDQYVYQFSIYFFMDKL